MITSQPTPPPNDARVRPLVIPRSYAAAADGQPARLFFYVVFMFDPHPLSAGEASLIDLLKRQSWPEFVDHTIRRCRLHITPDDGQAYARDLEFWTPRDLAEAKWKPADSVRLWHALVDPSLELPPAFLNSPLVHVIRPAAKVRSRQDQQDGQPAAGAQNPLRKHLRVNPIAATDLRPGQRIESFDSLAVAEALDGHAATCGALPAHEYEHQAIALLCELHEQRQLEDFINFLNWSAYPDNADEIARQCRHLYNMFIANRGADFKFEDILRSPLIKSASFQKAADAIVKAYHYYALHGGQTEFRRLRRFIKSARNRSLKDRSGPNAAGNGRDHRGITHLTSANADAAPTAGRIDRPSFLELMSQVRAHPGLVRRLGLALYCSIPAPDPKPLGSAVQRGLVRLELDGVEASSQKVFIAPPVPTQYEFSAGLGFFRPQPHHPRSFLAETPIGTADDVWRRYHLLPSKLFSVSQDDYSLAAASAYPERSAVDRSSTSTANESAARTGRAPHRVNSINIYTRPLAPVDDDQAIPATAAEAIDLRLKRGHPNPATRAMCAEDLMQGYTVYVRSATARSRKWRSLSRRMARLEVLGVTPGQAAQPIVYRVDFEEEGFIGNSMVFALAPVTGVVKDVRPDGTFSVQVVGAGNQIVGERTFSPQPPGDSGQPRYRISGLFVDDQPCDAERRLAIDDVVLVTPADPPRDGAQTYLASEVEIHPVLQTVDKFGGWKMKDYRWNQLQGLRACAVGRSGDQDPSAVSTLLIASHATRFLDEFGHTVAPPDMRFWRPLIEKGGDELQAALSPCMKSSPNPIQAITNPSLDCFDKFVIEGERRFYTLPRYQQPDGALQPFWAVTAGAPSEIPSLIVSASGTTDLFDRAHFVDASPRWRSITVPRFSPRGWGSPDQPGGADDVLRDEQMETLAVLSDPALVAIRGKVTRVHFALTVKLKQATDSNRGERIIAFGKTKWMIQDGDLPSIPRRGSKAEPIEPLACAPIVVDAEKGQPPIFDKDVALARLVGHAKVDGNTLSLSVDNVEPGWMLDIKKPLPPQLEWRVEIQPGKEGTATRQVLYSQPRMQRGSSSEKQVKEMLTAKQGGRFCHPAWVDGQYVEAVGSPRGSLIVGLAWPQNVWATHDPRAHRLVFSDGTTATHDGKSKLEFVDGPSFSQIAIWEPLPDGKPSGTFQIGPNTITRVVDDEGLVVVGEVLPSMKPRPAPATDKDLVIELRGLAGNTWTLFWPNYCGTPAAERPHLQPSSQSLPPRPLADLQSGELLVVRCDLVVPGSSGDASLKNCVKPRVVQAPPNRPGVIINGVVCLLGKISAPGISPAISAAEGTNVYHPCTLTTAGGQKLLLWSELDNATPRFGEVVAASCSAILAETITRFVPPTSGGTPDDPPPEPVHGTASELIARWSGWSLAVKMPGKADQPPDAPAKQLPFRICTHRPSLSGVDDREGVWKMPPLRFGRGYNICLRRTDLAGNHDFDEGRPAEQLSASGFGTLMPIRKLPRGAIAGTPPPSAAPFERTNPPAVPLLAFSRTAEFPKYAPGEPNTQPSHASCIEDLRLVVHKREASLVLISDVITPTNLAAADATGWLLPPPCAVETVLMSGSLDRFGAEEAASSIRWHERYFDDQRYALCTNGYLNYFADPDATVARLGLKNLQEFVDRLPRAADEVHFFDQCQWPIPRSITLTIDADSRSRAPLGGTIALNSNPLRVQPTAAGQIVRCLLPPGAQRDLVIDLLTSVRAVPHTMRLIHATNGAWTRPAWIRLEEKLPLPSDPVVDTSRKLEMELDVDVPTTGGYQVLAYWNDPWDESISTQHHPAVAIAQVGRDGQIESVRVENPGFGFGSQAVVLFEQAPVGKQKETVLEAVVVDGRIDRLVIHNPGSGWHSDVRLKIIRRPPFHRVAEATAEVENGAIRRIAVSDPGGWYVNPPIVIAHDLQGDGYGAILRATIDHAGRVDKVRVEFGGRGYSDDVAIRFYTNQYTSPEQPIPVGFQVAQAAATSDNGKLTRADVVLGGGPYPNPPIVVAHDLSGAGTGARLVARLDAHGAVEAVDILDGGSGFSPRVALGFYTTHDQVPKDLNVAKTDLSAWGIPTSVKFEFAHPFGDPRGRRVDYVVRVSSRFRKYLCDTTQVPQAYWRPSAEELARMHVPRLSTPWQLEVTSRVRPHKPDVAYMMHTFRWTVSAPLDLSLAAAKQYFRDRDRGRIVVTRSSLVRVYLHRPWHATGPEQLGVVVAPAVLNTIRVAKAQGTTSLSPSDGGSWNAAASPEASYELGYAQEPLETHATPQSIRGLVSRWGSDPVWNEKAFSPLTADHFLARSPELVYDWVPLADTISPSDTSNASFTAQPLWIALHDASYDTAKERWFVDIEVDLAAGDVKLEAKPFLQLALVTYQRRSLVSQRSSPVVQCDPFKLDGRRELEIERRARCEFSIALRGDFDHAPKPTDFPRREVVAELWSRDGSLSDDIMEYVGPVPESGPSGTATGRTSDALDSYPLERCVAGGYAAQVKIDENLLDDAQNHGVPVLWILEYEVHPAPEEQLSATDRHLVVIDGRVCRRSLVYSFSVQIGRESA